MAIDPRIRARRVAVRRAEGRRRLRFVATALVLVGAVVGTWMLSRSPLLDLDHVRVEGVSGERRAEVESLVDLSPGTPLVDLDLGTVAADIEELPWVASAVVAREWPGTVRMTIAAREPVAQLGATQTERVLIDAEGIITGPAQPDSELPLIAVQPTAEFGAVEPAATGGLAVALAMPPDLVAWVDAVMVSDEAGSDGRPVVGLDLVGGAVVELGTAELVEDKLEAVRAVLEGADLSCIVEIDVAVADLVSVERDPVCDGRVTGTEVVDSG